VKKRSLVFVLLCLGLVMVVLLAACGSPEKTTTTSKPPTATATSPFLTTSGPAPVVDSIVASPASVDLAGKTTAQLRITAIYNNDYKEVVTFQSRYSSGDTKIVTVSVGGLITAVAAGTTNITVTYVQGKTTKEITVPVSVK
jgi:type IV pilus biogenesis protein CpaD/CtpE